MNNKNLLMAIAILLNAQFSLAQVKGTFTDSRDGKIYKTVKIGTQTWMAENLAYKAKIKKPMKCFCKASLTETETNDVFLWYQYKAQCSNSESYGAPPLRMRLYGDGHYSIVFAGINSDGTMSDWDATWIPSTNKLILGNNQWTATNLEQAGATLFEYSAENYHNNNYDKSAEGTYAYNNDTNNIKVYGYLYTYASAKNACPTGWHLPSDAEWKTLTAYLGGDSVAGGKLKETGTTHWNSPNTGADNSSGFKAVPGGYRSDDGKYAGIGNYGYYWTSTWNDGQKVWYCFMGFNYCKTNIKYASNANGFSVRCIKD